MNKPAISVIVPVYNVENYLSECLESILNQTFHDFEIICVNDGATDNSYDILKDYAQKYENIKVINQENKGLSGARNTGIEAANGDYLAFIDSDDLVKEDFLEKLYNKAIETDADITVGNVYYLQNNELSNENYISKRISKIAKRKLLTKKDKIVLSEIPVVWNKLYKRYFFTEYGVRFYEGLKFEDIPFSFIVFALSNKIAINEQACYYYRKNDSSIMSKAYTTQSMFDIIKIFDRLHSQVLELINNNILPEKYFNIFNTYKINVFYVWNKRVCGEYKKEFKEKTKNELKDLQVSILDFKTFLRHKKVLLNN